jgi:HSP20 family protein
VARIYFERLEPGDDMRRIVEWLAETDRSVPGSQEWVPPMDVVETRTALQVVVDLPGVPEDAIRLFVARDRLVIEGAKPAGKCAHRNAAFHLVERSFGRFARAVRLGGAYDIGRASAVFAAGELLVTLPRIEERRGREIRITIQTA